MGTLSMHDFEDAQQARDRGRSRRTTSPRSSLATLVPGDRGALDILAEQNADRVRELVPLRWARMLMDPFSFYRGAAAVMTADLAAGPTSGLSVFSCGDAHLANFGIYASPERELVFDLNDFDEGHSAPFEWDVKRLGASVVIAGRHAGYTDKQLTAVARTVARTYAYSINQLTTIGILDRFYLTPTTSALEKNSGTELRELTIAAIKKARRNTSARTFAKVTKTSTDGTLRLREKPPVLVHLAQDRSEAMHEAFESYITSASSEIVLLLSQFTLHDVARRVVGVGSVGTQCFLAALTGPSGEPLLLQVKEAKRSVLETYGGQCLGPWARELIDKHGQGGRVVGSQRALQAVSDPFLGFLQFEGYDYYVRQFRDMKGSFVIDELDFDALNNYATACASVLARAHAQSPELHAIAGYLGKGSTFSQAIADFAVAYADKNAHDFAQAQVAAKRGKIDVAADPAR